MQKLIIYVLLSLSSFLLSAVDNYVLLVSFDGFRHDYTKLTSTPNFDQMADKGVKAESMIPVFPSLTFPNHYSIATGAYAATHNITGNTFYDKEYGEKYSLYDREKVRDPKFYKAEPIWVTAERRGIRTASFFWVGTEAPIKGYSPSIFKYYDGSVPFNSRIDSVLSWFKLPENQRPKLVLLYFSEPDHTGHNVGSDHQDVITKVEEMDTLLGYLMDGLKKLKIFENLDIFIVSDHGMTNVSKERLIILEDYLSRINDIYINGIGSHIQIDIKNNQKEYEKKLFEELKKIPHCQSWNKDDIPNRFHFKNRNSSDYLLLADEGWFITTKSAMKESPFTIKGMHGYDPKYSNMHGIFYAMGANIKDGMEISAFENIHIYPLICKLLDIVPYDGKNDAPQGNIEILKKILKKEKTN